MSANEILEIKDNQLIVNDSKMNSKQTIEVVINKQQQTIKRYRFVKTSNGKYLLN